MTTHVILKKKKVGFGSQITRWIYRVIQLRWMAIQPWCHYFHVHGVSNLPARKLHLSVLLYVLSVYVILYVFMWKHMKTCKIYIYMCVVCRIVYAVPTDFRNSLRSLPPTQPKGQQRREVSDDLCYRSPASFAHFLGGTVVEGWLSCKRCWFCWQ